MTNFRRKPVEVQAWRYNGEFQPEWPRFVADYKVNTIFGLAPITKTTNGLLLIPVPGKENGVTANYDDWLVLIDGVIEVVNDSSFSVQYEPIEG